jgi:membrane protein
MIRRLKSAGSLLGAAISGFGRHKVGRMAGAMAFDGILSLAPFGVILVTVAGLAYGRSAAEGVIVGRLRETLGEDASGTVQSLLRAAYVSRATVPATIVAFAVLIWGATRLIGDVRGALNDIWEVQGRGGGGIKGWLAGKGIDIVAVFVLAGLLLATMLAQAAVNAVTRYFADTLPFSGAILQISGIGFSLVVTAAVFMIVFRWLPNVGLAWRDVAFGGVLTAVLFTVGNYVLGFYLGRTSPGSIYGAAGSFIVLMLWMNYSSLMVLFGAEVTRARWEREHDRASRRPIDPSQEGARPAGR